MCVLCVVVLPLYCPPYVRTVFFIPCTSAGVPVLPARCFFGTRKFNDVFWLHFRPISFLRLILIVRGLFFALACILTERRIGAAKTRNKKLTTPGAFGPTIRRSLPSTYNSTTRYRCARDRKFSWNLYRCAARVVIAKSAWELQWCSSTRPSRAATTPLVFTLVSSPLHSMGFTAVLNIDKCKCYLILILSPAAHIDVS